MHADRGQCSEPFAILVVAEKYQTGYDEPLLCAMYVDKRLDGLQAVQTLSQLNRGHPGKDAVLVLDFENEVEAIKEAFQPYFETTEIDQPTDPHQVYTLRDRVMVPGFLTPAKPKKPLPSFSPPREPARSMPSGPGWSG